MTFYVKTSVSNGTGQCNFSGHRDRSFFVVPGQRDNGTSSKSCHGTGRAGTACQNLGRDAGRDNHYFSIKIRDGTIIMISCFRTSFFCFRTSFPVLERPFPVVEHLFPVLERLFYVHLGK